GRRCGEIVLEIAAALASQGSGATQISVGPRAVTHELGLQYPEYAGTASSGLSRACLHKFPIREFLHPIPAQLSANAGAFDAAERELGRCASAFIDVYHARAELVRNACSPLT